LLPARVLLNGSELKEGTWHPAAVELSAHVLADLEFVRRQWFVPVGRTFHRHQDWTVAVAYHGAVQLTDRHFEDEEAVAACNQRSSNMQRRCSRMLAKHGLTEAVGGKTPAADLYYAAVAHLVRTGKVSPWVRRRDLRKGYCGTDEGVEPFRDPYWQLKLKCTSLWIPDAGDADDDAATTRPRPTDPHSGLSLECQLEVLRRIRAAGIDPLSMPSWAMHRDRGILADVAEKLRHANPPVATKLQAEIVTLVEIATGRVTTDDAIPDDRTLQSLRHGSPALPPHVGGLSPEQCGVLSALRDGARMWRQWPEREHDVAPCDSQYRVVTQETTTDWDCAPRWKVVDYTLTEAQMATTCITARAENPRGSRLWLRFKEFVRRAKLGPKLWGQYSSSRCHGGGSERKTAVNATDSPARDELDFECGVCRRNTGDRSCSLFYPPLTGGDGEHQHDVAAFRPRTDLDTPEYLHELDPQPQISLIVADHGNTTEQQRTRMVNVDICSGSQSQRRGNLLLNLETTSFDVRTSVTATAGQQLTNEFIDASDDTVYDVVRTALHAERIAMSRVSAITLSSDCATNCTSAASEHRDDKGRPLRGKKGATARIADRVVINTLKFVHRARAERDYLLSTMD